MITVSGYKLVTLVELQKELQKIYAVYRETKNEMHLAICLGAGTTQTVRNSFRLDRQVVSDSTMTKLFSCLNLDAIIVWEKGKRYYYIKK